MDHIGIGKPVNGDNIYNGADDDASGCIAVLQLARALAHEKAPKRTVLFVFFGSEETGGQGNQYFLQHPPVPLKSIVANLEFEMIGRADSAVKPDELWLTGFDRSNLGPELAKHGAKLVADPHPKQNFFQRSDNYALAKQGIVAHTVSSFGLHPDYHQPGDDVAHIDFAHMDQAIHSMLEPVKWLANSEFKPEWVEGKKP
jgi:Zn-dependent M28 family amino/carboxypeptidase